MLTRHVTSSKKAQANWYRKLSEAWREAKPPPTTAEEAARLVIQTLSRHKKADVEVQNCCICIMLETNVCMTEGAC